MKVVDSTLLIEHTRGEQAADRDLERVRRLKSVYDRSETVVDLLSRLSLSRLQSLVQRGDNNSS